MIKNQKVSLEDNKIYLLEVCEKPCLIKVGDTKRDVEERNNETITNASLHRKKPVTYYKAAKYDGTMFRDKSLHKHLESAGYERELNDKGNKSEWFYITQDEFEIEFGKFTDKLVSKGYTLRPAQSFLKEKIMASFKKGNNHINVDACVRVGKTILSLDISKELGCMPVYIGKNLTSQTSVKNDNTNFGIVPEMLTVSIHGDDKHGDIIREINEKNVSDRDIIFFVDEVDDASHTEKSIDVIAPVVAHFVNIDRFGGFITMSGTRAYRGLKIQKRITDGHISEVSLAYYEMQQLQPEKTCKRNFTSITYYSDNAVGLTNISDTMKNKNHGHKSLGTTISHLLGTNEFGIDINPNAPHYFIKFSTVGKRDANALVKYLNKMHSEVEGQKFFYCNINGDVTSAKKAEAYCKDVIDSHPDKTIVFITQGMATTSFSVTGIGTSVVFTDNELTADDIQALHRSCTWKEGKEFSNLVLVTTNDSNELGLDDIFEDEIKGSETRDEKVELYKQILHLNGITHFGVSGNGHFPVTVTESNVEDILDRKMIHMTAVSSFVQSLRDSIDIDDGLVSGRLGITDKKSVTAKGISVDLKGNPATHKNETKVKTGGITLAKQEKILRAFVENAVFVPAFSRTMGVSILDFSEWDELQITKETFFDVYDTVPHFKDRIDTIYNLCSDDKYLLDNYISKISA